MTAARSAVARRAKRSAASESRSAARSMSSVCARPASSRSTSSCALVHSLGCESMAHRLPMTTLLAATMGKPAYATTPRSPIAALLPVTGSRRASDTMNGAWRSTTCWQKEWLSGVSRRLAQGSGRPMALLKNWRCSSTRLTSATGTPSTLVASRVKRSKACSAGVSSSASRCNAFTAARRAGVSASAIGSVGTGSGVVAARRASSPINSVSPEQ